MVESGTMLTVIESSVGLPSNSSPVVIGLAACAGTGIPDRDQEQGD